MKLFLVLVCLAASTLAGVIHSGGGYHGGAGPAYHGYDGSGAGHGGSGAGYYGSGGGYYGPGAGYGSGGGYYGGNSGLGGLSGSLGGNGAGLYGGGAGGLGLGLNGGLGVGGGFGTGGTGARGVVGVVRGGSGGALADGSRAWQLRANAARGTGGRAVDYGRDNGGFGNLAAQASARAQQANSAYGQNAADRNRDANAATYAAKLDAANAFDKRHWDGSNNWNQGQRHRVLGRGNNWRQGRRKHDDIDYAYDKRFDLRDNENGGFVLADSDKKHALDHFRDRVGGYHRNLDKDAAHASAADAQRAQQKTAAFHNDAAHAANSDAFARQTANTAGNHGRNRDFAQKLDHSKGGSGRWDNYRRSASDVYKNLASDHGSFAKKGRGALAPGGYGLGLAGIGETAGKPGYGDGYSGYGGPYDGSGYVAAAPLVGPGHAGSAPIAGHAGPVVGHHGPVVGPGGLVGQGGSLVGGGGVVNGGDLVRGAGYVSGGVLHGPGAVLGGGSGLRAAKANQNSLRDLLRHSDDAAKAHSTRAQYNRDQRLLHRDRAFDHDRHAAAADKGQTQNSRQAAHAANKAAAAKAAAARAAQADRQRAAFNENLFKNEAEKYRLRDRDNDRKVFKKWFNNKRRGGDNFERLNFDRDHKDDIYGQHVTALKDWAQAGNHNQRNRHHDHRGRNAQTARAGANARDSHASDWSKTADGFQNANAASGAKDDSKRRGFYNRDFGRNQGRNAYDGRVQNALQNHRGRSRSGLTGNARGVVGADAGISHNGVGGNFGAGLGGVHGAGNGGVYGSGYGGRYGSGFGGGYGNGFGGGYGKGLDGSGYGSYTGGHGFPGSGGYSPW